MAFEMMDRNGRQLKRPRHGTGDAGAHQQGSCKAWTRRVGNCIYLVEREPRSLRGLPGKRQYALDVVSRCQFGYNPAGFTVHGYLTVQAVREQTMLCGHHSNTCFVARTLVSKNNHSEQMYN